VQFQFRHPYSWSCVVSYPIAIVAVVAVCEITRPWNWALCTPSARSLIANALGDPSTLGST
jgi:hypothetical protein